MNPSLGFLLLMDEVPARHFETCRSHFFSGKRCRLEMNASNAFRSHLMQQFVAAARTQSRPPLALIGLMEESSKTNENKRSSPTSTHRSMSSIGTTIMSSPSVGPPSFNDSTIHTPSHSRAPAEKSTTYRLASTLQLKDPEAGSHKVESSDNEDEVDFAAQFQNLLQTRRTSTHFARHASLFSESYWKDALERAVLCGYHAPNHKRTEPFTFKRMIAPSPHTERLAEIAYNVNLKQQRAKAKGASEEAMLAAAEKKREKWKHIPAYLVALVSCSDAIAEDSNQYDQYDLLPYKPPATERELEDYASTCAAIQNVLLSLHSEQIASKWVTGPVIRTLAFRELVEAQPTDRVAALIMVGEADTSKRIVPRRHRRSLHGDVLVDL